MAGSEYYIDNDWDDMSYDFGMNTIPECYRSDFQFLCRILGQWVDDLSSPDQQIKNEAIEWINKKRDVKIVCGWIGINPNIIERFMRKKLDNMKGN